MRLGGLAFRMLGFVTVVLGALMVGAPPLLAQCELLEEVPPVGVRSVSVSVDWAAVGSTGYTPAPGFESAGGVLIYERLSAVWTWVDTLTAPDLELENQFGKSVAIDGEVMVVGAWYEDDPNGFQSGAAYVFRRIAGVWQFEAKISASDGDPGDEFGWEVAIDGGVIVVGARFDQIGIWGGAGSAYVFRDVGGGVWLEEAKVTADSPFVGDFFGMRVAIENDLIVVGAPFSEQSPILDYGAAFVFRFDGVNWNSEGDLVATIPGPTDNFGMSVDIAEGRAFIGASRESPGGLANAGAVHVFEFNGTTWQESTTLIPTDSAAGSEFASSIGATADTLIVGAHFDPERGTLAGAAYRFDRVGGVWQETKKFHSATTDIGDLFGRYATMDAETVLVAAPSDGRFAEGSISFFALDGPDCNQNSLCDAIDLAAGTSLDLDLSGIPDECEAVEAPVIALTCALDRTAVRLDWSVPNSDGEVQVFRDGALIVTLTGGTESYLDDGAPAGVVSYSVVRTWIGFPSTPTLCSATVPEFLIFAEDATALAGETAATFVRVENPAGPIQAFSYGLCLGAGAGTITGTTLGIEMIAMNGGAGPDFSDVNFVPGGITHAVVTSSVPGGDTLTSGGSTTVLDLTLLLPAVSGSFTVTPCAALGSPLVPLSVTSAGTPSLPEVQAGTITVQLAPVEALVCTTSPGTGVGLAWQNAASYSEVTIVRDGVPIVTLPGTATSANDPLPPAGYREYLIVAGQGAVSAEGVGCQVTVAPPPLENLVCNPVTLCTYDFSIEWDLPATCPGVTACCYDSIDISWDGQFVDDTDGCATSCCASQLTFPGPGTYEVCVDAWILETNPDGSGTLIYAPQSCCTVVVDPIPPIAAPTNFTCVLDPVQNSLTLDWTNESSYAQIEVRLNGALVETVAGGVTSTVVFPPSTMGPFDLCLSPTTTCGHGTPIACCTATVPTNPTFIRGDANGDGQFDISDPIWILSSLFGTAVIDCLDTADVNADLGLNIADPIAALAVLFQGAAPLAAPYPGCGTAAGSLSCDQYAPCVP